MRSATPPPIEKTPSKQFWKYNILMDRPRGQASSVKTINKLDEARTKANDQKLTVRQRSCDCVMAGVDF